MEQYYVNDNPQSNGDHEVHKNGCSYMPSILNRTYLGMFSSCDNAISEAKKKHNQVNGCYYCCRACHTS